MSMLDLVTRCRSYRRFLEDQPVSMADLERLVALARLTGSAANFQPLRYALVSGPKDCAKVFSTLAFAAYLKDWEGPAQGERPSAYIIMLGDAKHQKTSGWDMGIAAQTILLGAVELGLGGCMVHNVKRDELAKIIAVPEGFEILMVLALGQPKEKVVIEPLPADGDVKYWRTADNTHHVPKRSLDQLIVGRYQE